MKRYSKFAVRTLSILLAAVLLIGPLALGGEAYAADTVTKGTTTASLLFVRSGAGTGYKAVGSLWKGSSVDILEEKDGWYRISDGWISAKYVKTDAPVSSAPTPSTTPTTTPSTAPSTGTAEGNATVTASLLFIRKDPSTNYSAVGMLRKGDRIQVLETSGNWLKIKEGWVYSAYVAMDNSSTVYDSERTHVIVTVGALNIRENPSVLSKVVGSLTRYQKVEVLETSGNWLRISSGWINKNYVQSVNSSVTANNTGTVKASVLNIRSGPGTGYSCVGSLWYGEKVIILENQGDWYRINDGWVKASYIKIGS